MYLKDEKTHSANISRMIQQLSRIIDQMFEVKLVRSEVEHREPIVVGFFILQYAKLRMLELYYNFIKNFCDTDKYEELEMDTDSIYLALSEENLEEVIFPKSELNGTKYVLKIALITLLRRLPTIFSSELAVMPTGNMIGNRRDCLKKSLDVQNCYPCVAKPIVATIERVTSKNWVARDSIKELRKTVDMVPCQSIAKCCKRQSTLLQPERISNNST